VAAFLESEASRTGASAPPCVAPRRSGVRLLVFSTLYPNAVHPHHGIFVENRLRHLLAESGYAARVVAPVPWFPFAGDRFGSYAGYARVPREELRHGVEVWHPRYPAIPKVGMNAAPFLLYAAARRSLRALLREGGDFDLIDAHYFYPDGVAAALLAREFGKPFVVTGRGTDLNLIPRHALPRRLIRWTARQAAGVVTVCEALREDLAALGIPKEEIRALRNGVDLEMFRRDPAGARDLRARVGSEGPLLLSVGHLIPRKGHDLAIRALEALPTAHLLIAGCGPEEGALRRLTSALGVSARVHFLGALPHAELKAAYSAADLLVLASSREGWPNVLLESLACGTPVVATAVNGSPEVVRDRVAGRIVSQRTPAALAGAIEAVLADAPNPAAVRHYAEQFSWKATSRGQMALFEQILAGGLAAQDPAKGPGYRWHARQGERGCAD